MLASTRERLKQGMATTDDILGRVGVFDAEMLWWAHKRGICVATITPRERLVDQINKERIHEKLHCPTSEELLRHMQGKVAVISVVLDETRRISHYLAWIDKCALDPSVPADIQPFQLGPHHILVAHLLPGISAVDRLRELTS